MTYYMLFKVIRPNNQVESLSAKIRDFVESCCGQGLSFIHTSYNYMKLIIILATIHGFCSHILNC